MSDAAAPPRATEAERARLGALFAELCAIPSPSGDEARVRARVVEVLGGAGWACEQDAAGNTLARRADARGGEGGAPSVLLCAHLDTVQHHGVPIEPVLVEPQDEDGEPFWENANEAILGADNKAALAMLLVVAERIGTTLWTGPEVELLFTVEEEPALAGAKQFDVSGLRSDFGYVFDHATPIGGIVVASPTYYRFEAELRGRAAHAGIAPEDGRNAIVAAAHAIASMTTGRIDAETTANISYVNGGTSDTTNIVADRCVVVGEARSLDSDKVEAVVAELVDRLHDAANEPEHECDLDVIVERLFEGYRHKPVSPAIAAAERALQRAGHEPAHIVSGGAADANAFQAAGFHTVNLANGTECAHQTDERVTVAALEGMLDVVYALLEEVA
ncbi:M20/M25/M40 family metallo-hydrolase [Conexibacter woesei]|uniref:M20/M25/M40 family metallo-hydrolase n=1 Tax=Conexibacter woesei TaxID=191495 RepID=UPI00068895C3|nr:M20/M25/M40 family metallo-hydrolase [Conexibacter woesei]